ncbi:MAG: hypothetical protein SGPRY_014837, partial [Prymnesium sp.]
SAASRGVRTPSMVVEKDEQPPLVPALASAVREGERWSERRLEGGCGGERDFGVAREEAEVRDVEQVMEEEARRGTGAGENKGGREVDSAGEESGERWVDLVSQPGTSEAMESRALVLRNSPRRHLCGGELLEGFLSLPPELCWEEARLHACEDLTISLARSSLERSKLKSFLSKREGGETKLRQWPGKDGMQSMAAWWLAAKLVEAHAYTEPELYAIIQSECCFSADLGTIRKELVRRTLLEQPQIVQNPDKTTSTFYLLVRGRLLAVVEEWRAKSVL